MLARLDKAIFWFTPNSAMIDFRTTTLLCIVVMRLAGSAAMVVMPLFQAPQVTGAGANAVATATTSTPDANSTGFASAVSTGGAGGSGGNLSVERPGDGEELGMDSQSIATAAIARRQTRS
jgi:hypothetical protein